MERSGFTAFTAANQDEVTHPIERADKFKQTIDIINLDVIMPEYSGFDILRGLHVILVPLPPVIMLSAVTGIQQQIQARGLGAVKYITKPTNPT